MSWLFLSMAWGLWLVFLFMGKKRMRPKKSPFQVKELPTISVILPIKNEAALLPQVLVMWNNMPGAQLICIDDHSTDHSQEILKQYQANWFPSEGKGKKAALLTGWNLSETDWLVHTDADVLWTNEAWQRLRHHIMAQPLCHLHCLWPKLSGKLADQVDFAAMGATALGTAGWRLPFLASGASLAVRKKDMISHLPEAFGPGISGDDVFLLHHVLKTFGPKAVFGYQEPGISVKGASTWRQLTLQRLRWVGKSIHFTNRTAQIVSLWIFLFHASAPWIAFGLDGFLGVALLVVSKSFLDLWFMWDNKSLRAFVPLLSLAYWIYLPIIPLLGWMLPTTWQKPAKPPMG